MSLEYDESLLKLLALRYDNLSSLKYQGSQSEEALSLDALRDVLKRMNGIDVLSENSNVLLLLTSGSAYSQPAALTRD